MLFQVLMEQANHFEFQILYEMCFEELGEAGESLWVPEVCVRCAWRVWWTWFIISVCFYIFHNRLFVINRGNWFRFYNNIFICQWIFKSGDYNFVRQWFTFIFIYNSVFNFYAIVSLSNWLKFKIYVFRFRNFSVFFYIVYCNIAW